MVIEQLLQRLTKDRDDAQDRARSAAVASASRAASEIARRSTSAAAVAVQTTVTPTSSGAVLSVSSNRSVGVGRLSDQMTGDFTARMAALSNDFFEE